MQNQIYSNVNESQVSKESTSGRSDVNLLTSERSCVVFHYSICFDSCHV